MTTSQAPLPTLPSFRFGTPTAEYRTPFHDPAMYGYMFGAATAVWLVLTIGGASTSGAVSAAFGAWLAGGFLYLFVHAPRVNPEVVDSFVQSWCEQNGMSVVAGGSAPPNGPGLGQLNDDNGFRVVEVMEGQLNKAQTLVYSITADAEPRGGVRSTSAALGRQRFARIEGPKLPVSRIYIHPRWLAGIRFEGGFGPQFLNDAPISTESAAFNERVVVTMEHREAEIWARRILDPHTISSIVDGRIVLPELAYYDEAWRMIDRDHQTLGGLATFAERHRNAVEVIAMLSRVQSL